MQDFVEIIYSVMKVKLLKFFSPAIEIEISRFAKRSLVTKTLSKRFAARKKIVRSNLCYKYFQKVTTHYLKVKLAYDLKIEVDDLPIQSWSLLSCRIIQ